VTHGRASAVPRCAREKNKSRRERRGRRRHSFNALNTLAQKQHVCLSHTAASRFQRKTPQPTYRDAAFSPASRFWWGSEYRKCSVWPGPLFRKFANTSVKFV